MIHRVSLWIQVGFYLAAGINHFWHPTFYLPLIPAYLPFPSALNALSGMLEVVLAIGLAAPSTRSKASKGLVIMLLAFIPSHVYFIQTGSCVPSGLCTPAWVAYVRLLLVHPLLLLWAWWHRR